MKSLVLLLATIIVALIPKVSGLTCHACVSTTSDLDCYQNRRNEDCYVGVDSRCAKASYKIKGHGKVTVRYYRGCLKVAECKAEEYCKSAEGKTDCKTECCSKDLCNKKPGLPCYQCRSVISDQHCYQNRRNESCPFGQGYRCVKASYKTRQGQQEWYRGCLKVDKCKPLDYCKATESEDCKTECCSHGFCNGRSGSIGLPESFLARGVVIMLSVLILLVF